MSNAQRGQRAPQFSLPKDPEGHKLSLSDLLGKPAIIVFYPADFSPVCSDQLALYSELRDEWDRYGAQIVGISVDGVWCHRAYRNHRNIWFPLLADFEPKGEVSRMFDAYRAEEGVSERALFVLSRDGVVAWRYISPIGVNPGADGILEVLDRLQQEAA